MPAFAWAALGVSIAAVAGGAATAATNGLRAWRAFRQFRRSVGRAVDDVMSDVGAIEARLARTGETVAHVDRARRRLQESLAALAVIRASAGDARAALRVLGFLRR